MILNLSRQSKLVPAKKINEYTIKIFGVGSVGSHVAMTLAKTGFRHIHVYDNDVVENGNIAAQAYGMHQIGENKVDALQDSIKQMTGTEIVANHGLIDKDTTIEPEPNTIYCCFFDSLEARKMLFDKLKDFPVIFVDARIGLYNMRHYLVDCSEDGQVESYAKSLNTGSTTELECGEKASAPVNVQIAGKIVVNIVNYISGKSYTKVHISNASMPKNSIEVLEIREDKDD